MWDCRVGQKTRPEALVVGEAELHQPRGEQGAQQRLQMLTSIEGHITQYVSNGVFVNVCSCTWLITSEMLKNKKKSHLDIKSQGSTLGLV